MYKILFCKVGNMYFLFAGLLRPCWRSWDHLQPCQSRGFGHNDFDDASRYRQHRRVREEHHGTRIRRRSIIAGNSITTSLSQGISTVWFFSNSLEICNLSVHPPRQPLRSLNQDWSLNTDLQCLIFYHFMIDSTAVLDLTIRKLHSVKNLYSKQNTHNKVKSQ